VIITAGNQKISWDKLPTTPSVLLVQKQFDEIVAWLKEDKPVFARVSISVNYFKKGPDQALQT